MDNFIWIGNRLVNIAYIVDFVVEDNGTRITVRLAGVSPEGATITVDGEQAEAVSSVLDAVECGKPAAKIHSYSQISMPEVGTGAEVVDYEEYEIRPTP